MSAERRAEAAVGRIGRDIAERRGSAALAAADRRDGQKL
jgi:hypothetical protein